MLDADLFRQLFSGARLGITEHTDDNHRVFTFSLTNEDRDAIHEVLEQSHEAQLVTSLGDCGSEYRKEDVFVE